MNFIHAYMHVRMCSGCPPPEAPPLLYTMLGATISELVVVVVAVVSSSVAADDAGVVPLVHVVMTGRPLVLWPLPMSSHTHEEAEIECYEITNRQLVLCHKHCHGGSYSRKRTNVPSGAI